MVVALIFILSSVILAGLLLVPSYFLTILKSNAAEKVVQSVKVSEGSEETSEKIQYAKHIATMLKPSDVKIMPIEIISLITKHKGAQTKITSITYIRNEKNEIITTVRGEAKTRQDLVRFKDNLEGESKIAAAALPVSSFAQNTDIEFALTISLQ